LNTLETIAKVVKESGDNQIKSYLNASLYSLLKNSEVRKVAYQIHLYKQIIDLIKLNKDNEDPRIPGQLRLILSTLEDDQLHNQDLEKDEEEIDQE